MLAGLSYLCESIKIIYDSALTDLHSVEGQGRPGVPGHVPHLQRHLALVLRIRREYSEYPTLCFSLILSSRTLPTPSRFASSSACASRALEPRPTASSRPSWFSPSRLLRTLRSLRSSEVIHVPPCSERGDQLTLSPPPAVLSVSFHPSTDLTADFPAAFWSKLKISDSDFYG